MQVSAPPGQVGRERQVSAEAPPSGLKTVRKQNERPTHPFGSDGLSPSVAHAASTTRKATLSTRSGPPVPAPLSAADSRTQRVPVERGEGASLRLYMGFPREEPLWGQMRPTPATGVFTFVFPVNQDEFLFLSLNFLIATASVPKLRVFSFQALFKTEGPLRALGLQALQGGPSLLAQAEISGRPRPETAFPGLGNTTSAPVCRWDLGACSLGTVVPVHKIVLHQMRPALLTGSGGCFILCSCRDPAL